MQIAEEILHYLFPVDITVLTPRLHFVRCILSLFDAESIGTKFYQQLTEQMIIERRMDCTNNLRHLHLQSSSRIMTVPVNYSCFWRNQIICLM